MSENLILYFKWLIPLFILCMVSILILKVPVISLLLCLGLLFVPPDRVRVKMLKKQESLPERTKAIRLILFFSTPPMLVAIYVGVSMEAVNGSERLTAVFSSLLVLYVVPLIFLIIQFMSKTAWSKALAKYSSN